MKFFLKPHELNLMISPAAEFVDNKAQKRILKRRQQENKAREIFRKTNFSYPLERKSMCAYYVRSYARVYIRTYYVGRAGKIRRTVVQCTYRVPEVVSRRTKYHVPKIFISSDLCLRCKFRSSTVIDKQ